MRSEPFGAAAVSPRTVSQGIAFCCNFSIPPQWQDMADCFDIGELFVPDHAYSHFMCGSVVAATSFHKHLVCALGPAASRDPNVVPSYQTSVRRMVVDMGSTHSINIAEFSWMRDGALIVTVKILVPPDPAFPFRSAGCTGAFALFTDVIPGGPAPLVPRSLVSFVEVPRCPLCIVSGSLGCYCSNEVLERFEQLIDDRSSAVWPPRLTQDVQKTDIDTYHNIRSRLDMIQHISHVKITAHVVTGQDIMQETGPPVKTYRLGPSRFVIKAVLFRPSTGYEADILRQVADKLRLLKAGSLRVTMALLEGRNVQHELSEELDVERNGQIVEGPGGDVEQQSETQVVEANLAAAVKYPGAQKRMRAEPPTSLSHGTSRVSTLCQACNGAVARSEGASHTCSRSQTFRFSAVSASRRGKSGAIESLVTDELSDGSFPTKKIRCPLCGKCFSQQGSLNRHLKNIHEERKLLCQFCNMAFGQMFDLKVSYLQALISQVALAYRLERGTRIWFGNFLY